MALLAVLARKDCELQRARIPAPPQLARLREPEERLDQLSRTERGPNLEEHVDHLFPDRVEAMRDSRRYGQRLAGAKRALAALDGDSEDAREHLVPFFLKRLNVLNCHEPARPKGELEAQKLAA
jgi:hypothetical protein